MSTGQKKFLFFAMIGITGLILYGETGLIYGAISAAATLWLGLSWLRDVGKIEDVKQMRQKLNATPEFEIQKSFFKYDIRSLLYGVAIDDVHKKFAFIEESIVSIVRFDSIITVALVADEETLTRTDRGSQVGGALLGSALLGPAGLFIGGLSGKSHSKKLISEMTLKVVADNLNESVHKIIFFSEKKPRLITKPELQVIDEWYSRLQVIVSRNEKAQKQN